MPCRKKGFYKIATTEMCFLLFIILYKESAEAIFLFAVLHSKTQHVLGGLLGTDLL